MKYFNGFSLQHEEALFDVYNVTSKHCVVGFSYGAQKALEYAYTYQGRIDRLILFSPAFFQNQKPSFIRAQLRYFEADKEAYVKQFLANVSFPSSDNLETHLKVGTVEDLERLLNYVWENEKIEALSKRGVSIEVFFGAEDKIIDVPSALDFFNKHCTTYTLKGKGHILQ